MQKILRACSIGSRSLWTAWRASPNRWDFYKNNMNAFGRRSEVFQSFRLSIRHPRQLLSPQSHGLPQHQRLFSSLIGKARPRKPLSFAAGDAHYSERLASVEAEDEKYFLDHSGKILEHVRNGSSAAKRMFLELRDIRSSKVPFVSAVPLDDSLDEILASIEGPPETPYEGGVFFITVKSSESSRFNSHDTKSNNRIN